MGIFYRDIHGVRCVSEQSGSLTIDGGGNVEIDMTQGTTFFLHLTDNVTDIIVENTRTGSASSFTMFISMDGTPRTVTWPSKFKWQGGIAPTLTSTSESVDVISFVTLDSGDSWYGFMGGQDFQ